ncbi:MAG: A/G-specific adenine glycosylase [Candidatus Izemoplasmatales bacterium]
MDHPSPAWTQRLLAWYREAKRPLPWRDAPDPYRVWISEIMGQQTRMEVLIPYFERFVDRLPTLSDLAAVPDDELLKLWEGLGYYRRAALLKKAAIAVMEHHGGVIPNNREDLLALPGVGAYTAGAILSIAFGVFEPAVDGNVRRVLSRAFGIDADPGSADGKASFDRLVRELAPAGHPGDYVQALMELGALVCLPNGAPKCETCPVKDECVARRENLIDALPRRAAKKERRIEEWTVVVLRTGDGSVVLRRRPAGGLLGGMWGLPSYPGTLTPAATTAILLSEGVRVDDVEPLAARTHVFTHVEWRMTGYRATASQPVPETFGNARSTAVIAAEDAIPSAYRGWIEELDGASSKSNIMSKRKRN